MKRKKVIEQLRVEWEAVALDNWSTEEDRKRAEIQLSVLETIETLARLW